MQDEGDLHCEVPPVNLWWVAGSIVVIFVLLTAVLVIFQ